MTYSLHRRRKRGRGRGARKSGEKGGGRREVSSPQSSFLSSLLPSPPIFLPISRSPYPFSVNAC